MNKLWTSMAVLVGLTSGSQGMEGEEPRVSQLIDELNGLTLAEEDKSLSKENPLLEGELLWTEPSDEQVISYKIKDLIDNESTLNLSNKDIFGDGPNFYTITTSIEKFLYTQEENSQNPKLLVLIASRSLINDYVESNGGPFEWLMPHWTEGLQYGVFGKMTNWTDPSAFSFAIRTADYISKHSLSQVLSDAKYSSTVEKSEDFDCMPIFLINVGISLSS